MIISSAAAAAAYAIAAYTASRVRPGYSLTMFSGPWPSARLSRTTFNRILVPLITGAPPQTPGFDSINGMGDVVTL